jgi:two-component system, chemotaxis family, protein-glutamate methylesterase/glutaminase
MNPIRVLVIDDSAAVRRMLRMAISEDPEMEVAGVAANGPIALAMLEQKATDLVTLDLEMPEMDGLTMLQHLRQKYARLPVLTFSGPTGRAAATTALSRGATDYVTKPVAANVSAALVAIREQLIPRIKILCRSQNHVPHFPTLRASLRGQSNIEVVAIGISTGGPNALIEVVAALPRDLPVPLLVVQHMPAGFTGFLAGRLSLTCALPVREATGGEPLLPGTVWIAPGDQHLVVTGPVGREQFQLLQSPPENSCRPSVDVLFRSLASRFGPRVLGIIMTGMGHDGLRGAREICAADGRVWVQDENTSAVWGMPGLVAQHGLAERVLPLSLIGPEMARTVRENRDPSAVAGTVARSFHERLEYDLRIPGAVGP